MTIILGSQSKSRKKVMDGLGLKYEVMVSDIDEKAIRHEDPKEMVMRIATAKADALAPKIAAPAILITADTVIIWQGQVREKPADAEEAKEFMRGYNVAPAEVLTAVVVTNLTDGKRRSATDSVIVHFKHISEEEIAAIAADGMVLNYAGGFTLLDDRHVERIDGTLDGALGLPIAVLNRLLAAVTEN